MTAAKGVLIVSRPQPGAPGSTREVQLPFGSLDELIGLCARESQGGAFVRVQVTGVAAGREQRLVLDFGHFGPSEA